MVSTSEKRDCALQKGQVFASNEKKFIYFNFLLGWSGGAMVLGKLPVPGRPTTSEHSRARAYIACGRCGWGLFGHFSLVCRFSFLSPALWETARYYLKYCLKGPLSPKQPTNLLIFSLAQIWIALDSNLCIVYTSLMFKCVSFSITVLILIR